MKNKSRLSSPPAAYAKYLNDFEECDELQLAPTKKKPSADRASRDDLREYSAKSLSDYSRGSHAVASTSHSRNDYGKYSAEKDLVESEDSLPEYSDNLPPQRYIAPSPNSFGSHVTYNAESLDPSNFDTQARSSSQQGYTEDLDSIQEIKSKPKSIYDIKSKPKKKSKKICFAFAKFGDCHYGADCKFSHDPKLLKQEEQMNMRYERERGSDRSPGYNHLDNPDATCRQLEQRLLEIQRELTLLEEESKKPKSSVVVPKKNKSSFASGSDGFGSNVKASINVGGDFIVRVGNSRRDFEDDRRDVFENRAGSSLRREDASPSFHQGRRENAMAKKRSHGSRAKVAHSRTKLPMFRSRTQEVNVKEDDLLEISDDDDNIISSQRRTTGSHAGDDRLRTDWISSSDSEDQTAKKRPKNEFDTAVDIVSEGSEEEGLLSLSDDDLVPAPDAVSDDDDRSSELQKEDNAEPIDFSSVIDPECLIDISDHELEDADLKPSSSRKPLSCREEYSAPFILRKCQLIYEKLPQDVIDRLKRYGIEEQEHELEGAFEDICNEIVGDHPSTGVEQRKCLEILVNKSCHIDEDQLNELHALAEEANELFSQY